MAAAIESTVKESVSPWPNWFRSTLSAAVGASIVFAGAVLYIDKAKTDATAALSATADHEVRLRTLEERTRDDSATLKSLKEKVDELRIDVKTLLQRTPPK